MLLKVLLTLTLIQLTVLIVSSEENNTETDAKEDNSTHDLLGFDVFYCRDEGKKELFLDQRCDGRPDCDDGMDEENCTCPPGQFRASTGYCVSSLIEFIQVRYCHRGQNDEIKCDKDCEGSFRCASDYCISKDKVCDGKADCYYAIDEWVPECDKVPNECSSGQKRCHSELNYNLCLNNFEECFFRYSCLTDTCDSNAECNSDEFHCADKGCINKSSVCDGKWRCYGGVDETPYACDLVTSASIFGLIARKLFIVLVACIFVGLVLSQMITIKSTFRSLVARYFGQSESKESSVTGESAVSAKSKENLSPIKSQEKLLPTKSKENLPPIKSKENLSPTKPKENLLPTKSKENLLPTKSKEKLLPTKSKENFSPTKSKENLQITKSKEVVVAGKSKLNLQTTKSKVKLQQAQSSEKIGEQIGKRLSKQNVIKSLPKTGSVIQMKSKTVENKSSEGLSKTKSKSKT